MDKLVILYPVLGQVRKLILAFTMVFLQNWPNFSIFSINFQTLMMIIMIGLTTPFKSKGDFRIENFNEFTILVVNYHLMSLTDWVYDGNTRYTIGWSMIAVTSLGIFVNLSILARQQFLFLRLKHRKWAYQKAHAKHALALDKVDEEKMKKEDEEKKQREHERVEALQQAKEHRLRKR